MMNSIISCSNYDERFLDSLTKFTLGLIIINNYWRIRKFINKCSSGFLCKQIKTDKINKMSINTFTKFAIKKSLTKRSWCCMKDSGDRKKHGFRIFSSLGLGSQSLRLKLCTNCDLIYWTHVMWMHLRHRMRNRILRKENEMKYFGFLLKCSYHCTLRMKRWDKRSDTLNRTLILVNGVSKRVSAQHVASNCAQDSRLNTYRNVFSMNPLVEVLAHAVLRRI